MKKTFIIALSIFIFSYGHAKKWLPDSTYKNLMVNTAYSAPMVHIGMQLGLELPIKRSSRQFNTLLFLSKIGLEKWGKPRTMYRQLSFEPSVLMYNHRFNHTGFGLSGILHYRVTSQTRLSTMFGIEYGRLFQFYRDAIVFDERNSPSSQAFLSNGYNQLGGVFETGFVLNRKKNYSIYYRLHAGLLFPYNHLMNSYLRNEFGLRILNL